MLAVEDLTLSQQPGGRFEQESRSVLEKQRALSRTIMADMERGGTFHNPPHACWLFSLTCASSLKVILDERRLKFWLLTEAGAADDMREGKQMQLQAPLLDDGQVCAQVPQPD